MDVENRKREETPFHWNMVMESQNTWKTKTKQQGDWLVESQGQIFIQGVGAANTEGWVENGGIWGRGCKWWFPDWSAHQNHWKSPHNFQKLKLRPDQLNPNLRRKWGWEANMSNFWISPGDSTVQTRFGNHWSEGSGATEWGSWGRWQEPSGQKVSTTSHWFPVIYLVSDESAWEKGEGREVMGNSKGRKDLFP